MVVLTAGQDVGDGRSALPLVETGSASGQGTSSPVGEDEVGSGGDSHEQRQSPGSTRRADQMSSR